MKSFSDRNLEAAIDVATNIIKICDDVKTEQTAWLAARGLTWEEARALPEAERAALSAAYATSL